MQKDVPRILICSGRKKKSAGYIHFLLIIDLKKKNYIHLFICYRSFLITYPSFELPLIIRGSVTIKPFRGLHHCIAVGLQNVK